MSRLGLWFAVGIMALHADGAAAAMARFALSFDEKGIPMMELPLGGEGGLVYLDTGSTGVHILEAAVDGIEGLLWTGRQTRSSGLDGKMNVNKELLIPLMRVQGLEFREIKGETLTPWGIGGWNRLLPVVGLDVLLQKDVVIDYPRSEIVLRDLDDPASPAFAPTMTFSYDRWHEGFMVPVSAGARAYAFVLDTGASHSLLATRTDVDPALVTPCPADLMDGACSLVESGLRAGGTVPLSRVIRIDVPEFFKPDGVLGRDFLRQCAVHINAAERLFEASCAP
jgi:hypothetical protein